MGLAMNFSNFSILSYAVYSRILSINLWKIFHRPLLISSFMALVLLITKNLNFDLLITVLIAVIAYMIFGGFLVLKLFGGFKSVKQKLLSRE